MKKINDLYIKSASLLYCFICIFMVLFAISIILKEAVFYHRPQSSSCSQYSVDATEKEKKISSAGKEFTPDGRLLLIETTKVDDNHKKLKIYDRDYNFLWEGDAEDVPTEYSTIKYDGKSANNRPYISSSARSLTPDMRRDMIVYNRTEDVIECWRYNDRGYFEGFIDGEPIGYIGVKGFGDELGALEKFNNLECMYAYTEEEDYSAPVLLCSGNNNLYFVDIKNRQFNLLYENIGTMNDSRVSLYDWFTKNNDGEPVGTILIVNKDRKPVVIFKKDLNIITLEGFEKGQAGIGIAFNDNPENKYDFFITSTHTVDSPGHFAPRAAIEKWFANRHKSKHKVEHKLYGLGNDRQIQLISEFDSFIIAKRYSLNEEMIAYESKVGYLLDVAPVISYYILNSDFAVNAEPKIKVFRETMEMLRLFKPYHVWIAWTLGGICAAVVYLHGRNRIPSKAALIGWILFALLFNVAGMLTCLALTHYNLVKCENCGKKRHLLREKCLHCKKEMPAPAPSATDIICG
ncbi:MAG: hypothetical protein ACIAQZ_17055 [Sedimentisphaeraceae bacterium JB056]